MRVALPDLATMEAFGHRIAERLAPGDVVALSGTLGTGKTTLARAILAALGHRGEVPSPTYTIVETYDGLRLPVVHADFYRLEDPGEVEELGLDDYREGAALLAEWPDQAGGFAHEAACLSIDLEKVGDGREAVVTPGASWQSRWP
ncbi:tRNA (adenosine(37)-N6)-threonylcarbamoyltransferase complex ATPase subunit type 1 TsaE [Qipengyuania sp.]|uniref:tRNA (adenosine(37)-N6)-threonylcarbamoyltransferase complex ATPase subunit type 1 TsaE n=1 Tax=Qipengyuania sp. TaxID=2004515 RepID=UPI003AF89C7A